MYRLIWAGFLLLSHFVILLTFRPNETRRLVALPVSLGTTASISLLLMTLIHLTPFPPPVSWIRKISQADSILLVLLAWLLIPTLLVKSLIHSLPDCEPSSPSVAR